MNTNGSLLIHERKDRRMEPFYWILTFEVMAILIVLAVAMVAGPIVLLWYYREWWAYALLAVGVALAVPLARFDYRYMVKLVRKNRRLSSYRIYEDRIEATVYDISSRSTKAKEDQIPLKQVESVYASMHAATQTYHYKKTGWKERVPQFELLPILYIVYNSGWDRHVLTVPFYGGDAVDWWLGVLQERNVPIKATSKLLHSHSEADQLEVFDSGTDVFPFPYERNYQIDFRRLMDELVSRTAPVEAASSAQDSPPQKGSRPGMEPAPGGSDASWLRYPSLGMLMLLIASLYPVILLEEAVNLPAVSTILCFGLLFAGAVAYFYRMRRLTLWAPLRFVLIAGLGWLILGGSLETRGDIAADVASTAAAAVILQPVLVWLPYWAAVRIRRRWPASYHLQRKQTQPKGPDVKGKEGSA